MILRVLRAKSEEFGAPTLLPSREFSRDSDFIPAISYTHHCMSFNLVTVTLLSAYIYHYLHWEFDTLLFYYYTLDVIYTMKCIVVTPLHAHAGAGGYVIGAGVHMSV